MRVKSAERGKMLLEMSKEPHTLAEYAQAAEKPLDYTKVILRKLGIVWSDKSLYRKREESICFRCQTSPCNWVLYHEPIEGWEAVETKLKYQSGYIDSFCVSKCPNHTPTKESDKMFRKFCDAVYTKLIQSKDTQTTLLINKRIESLVTSIMPVSDFEKAIGLKVEVYSGINKWKLVK